MSGDLPQLEIVSVAKHFNVDFVTGSDFNSLNTNI